MKIVAPFYDAAMRKTYRKKKSGRKKKLGKKKKEGRDSLQEINENVVDDSKAYEKSCLDSEDKYEFYAHDSFGDEFY